MQPSDERRIERFVRAPESMSEGQRRETKRLIEEDAGARAYAEFLRGVYDRLAVPAPQREEAQSRRNELLEEFPEFPHGRLEIIGVERLEGLFYDRRLTEQVRIGGAGTGPVGFGTGADRSPRERSFWGFWP